MAFASIAATLTPLALLACPIGMGVMMWMMGRGNKQRPDKSEKPSQAASLEVLREEEKRLKDEIARAEGGATGDQHGVGSAT